MSSCEPLRTVEIFKSLPAARRLPRERIPAMIGLMKTKTRVRAAMTYTSEVAKEYHGSF
jgi:hypothetical protein